jgi:hypothetical protein
MVVQIIVLELFMDVGASSTFTLEPADAHLMCDTLICGFFMRHV